MARNAFATRALSVRKNLWSSQSFLSLESLSDTHLYFSMSLECTSVEHVLSLMNDYILLVSNHFLRLYFVRKKILGSLSVQNVVCIIGFYGLVSVVCNCAMFHIALLQ